jgi:hypothetical protein
MQPTRPPMSALRPRRHADLPLRHYAPLTSACSRRCGAPFAQDCRPPLTASAPSLSAHLRALLSRHGPSPGRVASSLSGRAASSPASPSNSLGCLHCFPTLSGPRRCPPW